VIDTLGQDEAEQADLRGGCSPWFDASRRHLFSSVPENTKCDALIWVAALPVRWSPSD
jgi:hypothetical protein